MTIYSTVLKQLICFGMFCFKIHAKKIDKFIFGQFSWLLGGKKAGFGVAFQQRKSKSYFVDAWFTLQLHSLVKLICCVSTSSIT